MERMKTTVKKLLYLKKKKLSFIRKMSSESMIPKRFKRIQIVEEHIRVEADLRLFTIMRETSVKQYAHH